MKILKPGRGCLLLAFCCLTWAGLAQDEPVWDQGREQIKVPSVLPWKERYRVVNEHLSHRLESLLPGLMRQSGIDMWLVINREYNEDPVYLTLVPEPSFAARRTTILLFFDRGEDQGVEKLVVGRYAIGDLYQAAWEGGDLEAQWRRLGEVIAERNPRKIGINTSRHWPVADGLSAGLRDRLFEVLNDDLQSRVVSAEQLCVRWLETRTEMEIQVYGQIVAIARSVIAEAFSNRVITPGVTTTDDVAVYIRQRFSDLGLPIWFHPYVNLQRQGKPYSLDNPFFGGSGTILRGDVLHTDVGITYMRLNTDTQEMAYVLKNGENEVPKGLRAALETGNRWQDLLTDSFKTGRSGNQILATTREKAASQGINCSVYTHPLGFFGHAPGPTIGMWDNQGNTAHRGDWPLYPHTVYAIEGNVKVAVPEWDGQHVQIKMEQDGYFNGDRVVYLGGRQTRWHTVE